MQILAREKNYQPGSAEKMPQQLSLFRQRLPYRPYCTDDLSTGLHVRPALTALEKRYVQYNPPSIINWLAFDIDRPYTLEADWSMVAPPNISRKSSVSSPLSSLSMMMSLPR